MGWMTIKGKTALVRNVDAAYVKGDFLKINSSGIFTKATSIDEASGVALETLTTTSDLLLANVFEKGNFVNLSLSGSANSLKIENSGGTDVVLKGGQGIGILEVVGTLDTAYIYTLEHWGEVSIAGGSTSVTAGTPERPDNDTPGTPTASLSSEFTQSGSTITYTGVAGQAELAGAISFTTDAIGDYLVSLYQEGVELPVTEVRVSCLIGSYVTIPVLTTSVNVATNDTFDLRIEPVTGSANITVHRYNVYARKIY